MHEYIAKAIIAIGLSLILTIGAIIGNIKWKEFRNMEREIDKFLRELRKREKKLRIIK